MMLNRLIRRHGSISSVVPRIILMHRPSMTIPALCTEPSACATLSTQHRYNHQGAAFRRDNSNHIFAAATAIAASASGVLFGGSASLVSQCESSNSTNPIDEETEEEDTVPTFTMDEVSKHNGQGPDKRIWMTYGGCVYDVTDFIANHPGGSEKILLAAGGPVEPHWHCEL